MSEYGNAALSAFPLIGFYRMAKAEYQAVEAALSGDVGAAVDAVVPVRPTIQQAKRAKEKLEAGEYEEAGRATFGALDSGVNSALVLAGGARTAREVGPRIGPATKSIAVSLVWPFVGAGGTTVYRRTFFAAHPELEGKVVVHHAIEQQAAKKLYPGLVSEEELHGLPNLRGIPKDVNADIHLSKMRKDWNQFYRTHPNATRAELDAYRAELDKKYGQHFNPPVKDKP